MTYHLHVAANGRIVLPAEVRKRLGLSEGGELLMEETPNGLVLRTVAQAVAEAQAIARRYLADRPEPPLTLFSRAAAPKAANDGRIVLDASALLAMIREEAGG